MVHSPLRGPDIPAVRGPPLPDIEDWTVILGRGRTFLTVALGQGEVYCYAGITTPSPKGRATGRLRHCGDQVVVIVPDEPAQLTPSAGRVLLRILLKSADCSTTPEVQNNWPISLSASTNHRE